MNYACRTDITPQFNTETARHLHQLINSRVANIGIIGLGYVGVPLALAAVASGFTVTGFDISSERIETLNKGCSGLRHISDEQVMAAVSEGKFSATDDFSRLKNCDAIIICVPTPLTKHREPDMSYIIRTSNDIAKNLRVGQLVVLESTTYPGTTKEVVQPLLESSGLRVGIDFFLGFSPEREDPGNPDFGTRSIPKIVGSDDNDGLLVCASLYEKFIIKVERVSSTATAEAVKITENIFRAVNIALVNELKLIYKSMGIDIWEVIDAAKTKPFGFMPFYPGPGLGGHCIPIDPFYLTWKAREFDVTTRFIELAGEINTRMPYYIVDQISRALEGQGRSINGSKVLIIGLAYKKNIDDIRESPSLKILELLLERGSHAVYHDPFVEVIPATREHQTLTGMVGLQLNEHSLANVDACVILTDHDQIDYDLIVKNSSLIIDTRNAIANRGLPITNVTKA